MVGKVGFEPTHREGTDLQSAATLQLCRLPVFFGARGGDRTRMPKRRQILSLLNIPISPLSHLFINKLTVYDIYLYLLTTFTNWRPCQDSNPVSLFRREV